MIPSPEPVHEQQDFLAYFEHLPPRLVCQLLWDDLAGRGRLQAGQGFVQVGLEASAARKIIPEHLANQARREMLEIRQEILLLMDRFRGRDQPGGPDDTERRI